MRCCWVCKTMEEELDGKKLLACSRCNKSTCLLCGPVCQHKDWIRHKGEGCFKGEMTKKKKKKKKKKTKKKKKKQPAAHATSSNDVEKVEKEEYGDISNFFKTLCIMRGRPDCRKIMEDRRGLVDLTDEDYAQIAYPYPQITFAGTIGAAGIYDYLCGRPSIPQTFHAPDGKAFTVRQLAEAFAKAESHNENSRHCFFEGFRRTAENPHTFVALFGPYDVVKADGHRYMAFSFTTEQCEGLDWF